MVDGTDIDRQVVQSIVDGQLASAPSPPALEVIDRPTFELLQRLAASGIVRFPSEARRSLYRSASVQADVDPERERRLAAARELREQCERKIRMAGVLAGGGFPVEALPALREGVELGLRAGTLIDGMDLPEAERVPVSWIEKRLPNHLPLIRTLRDGSETLLAATDAEVRAWIQAGETLAHEIGGA